MKDWNITFFGTGTPTAIFDEVLLHLPGNMHDYQEHTPQQYLIHYVVIEYYDKPAGRLCLYQNPFIGDGRTLLFGNLACINDEHAFWRLMQAVKDYAENTGFTTIAGPINGSTWEEYRLPVSHFGMQFITDLPQPEYYTAYLLQAGFSIAHRYFTYLCGIEPKTTSPALLQLVEKAGITVRPINLKNYDTELEKLYPFCNTAFANNALFSPISKEGFLEKYLQVKPLLKANFVWLAEDATGTLQAFILCLPDPYQVNRLVMKTIARNIYNRQSAGLVKLLANIIYNKAYDANYRYMLHAFMHSSNRSKVLSEKYSGQVFKEYALFTKIMLP